MPLFKRKPYMLRKPPRDLKPDDAVFQVRFTKEVFRDYEDYLSCMKLYRRRVWTCKVSGKTNLTYEEAIVSERKASEKVQHFPKEFMGPVLQLVQFSPLRVDELVDRVYKDFKDRFVIGEEVTASREDSPCACRILKVLEQEEDEDTQYEVAWLGDDGKKISTSVEIADKLTRKKHPFTRALLKAFIRESASSGPTRNSPWFVHDKLARKYKIATDAPEKSGSAEREPNRTSPSERGKRAKVDEMENGGHDLRKRRRRGDETSKKGDEKRRHGNQMKAILPMLPPVRYPIDDLLVKSTANDPPLSDRPVPSTDFLLPMECIGNLLMVWDFCCLFGKALHLSPFTLEEFEKSLDYREGDAPVLIEVTYALLRAALTDTILRDEFCHKRKRRTEVSMGNWKDDLCDFLELPSRKKLTPYASTIRQGFYREIEVLGKLQILHELVDCSLNSSTIRSQIDENIEEHQLIAARKREVEVEELKRRKEEREGSKRPRTEHADDLAVETSAQGGGSLENGEDAGLEDIEDGEEAEMKEERMSMEDGHPTGWTVKGKRNSIGTHSPTNYSNGVIGKNERHHNASVSKSRQTVLKEKVALKLAEGKEKEAKRVEDLRKLQEKRKEQAEALVERKHQEQKVAERQRKQEHLEREMEKHYIRTNPLARIVFTTAIGFFLRDGRLFVESEDSVRWGYYSAKEEFDTFYGSLNVKGIREKSLQKQMEKLSVKISNALQKRSKELAQRFAMEESAVRRSVRVRTAPRPTGFLAYTNRLRTG